MRKRTDCWIVSALLVLLALFQAVPVRGQEAGPVTGNIRIVLEESSAGRSRKGVELSLYPCADLVDGQLVFKERYEDCAVETKDLSRPAIVRETKEKLRKVLDQPSASLRSDENGVAVFENLPLGLYMVRATDPAGYEQIGDMLICLPAWNEKEGSMEYSISVYAKALQIPDIVIEKTDPDGRVILGREFVFTSYRDAACTMVRQTVTGQTATGQARFGINLNETLYIRETSAPLGYILSSTVITVRLSEDGQLFVNEQPVLPKDGTFRIRRVNRPLQKAAERITPPRTGLRQKAGLWTAAAVVSILLTVLLLRAQKNKKRPSGDGL